MVDELGWPVHPARGFRGADAWGSGAFGATRDGGLRKHLGLDFLALPGDIALSPITGHVTHIGLAYADSNLGSIHIQGDGEHAHLWVKILYADPDVYIRNTVKRGDRLGTVQNVSAWYSGKSPGRGLMQNHVHVELRAFVDPGAYLSDPTPEA